VLLGLLGNTLFHILLVSAIHHTTPGHAAVLVALSPALAAVLARLLLGEALGRRRVSGIVLGFAGVALIVTRSSHGAAASTLGDLLSLGASLSWALYTVVGKDLLTRATPLAVTTWATVVGVFPMLPVGLPGLVAVSWSAITPWQWFLLVYLSAGTIALGNLLWYVALARSVTARVVVFSFLAPLIATVMAALAGQGALTPALVLGGAAVLGGVALAQRA
jgi:drug/metabolite transporter (DMT)-like permease